MIVAFRIVEHDVKRGVVELGGVEDTHSLLSKEKCCVRKLYKRKSVEQNV